MAVGNDPFDAYVASLEQDGDKLVGKPRRAVGEEALDFHATLLLSNDTRTGIKLSILLYRYLLVVK